MRKSTVLTLTAAALAGYVGMAPPAVANALKVAENETNGEYVTDAENRTLYVFTADRRHNPSGSIESACYDDCAATWLPLLVNEPPQADEKIKQSLVGVTVRKDGKLQATFGGWPLYYYAKDTGPGSSKGQEVHGDGGQWFLVSPQGAENPQGGRVH